MGSWHLVPNAPDGSLEARAEWIAQQWETAAHRTRLAELADISPQVMKAMTLELLFAYSRQRRKPPVGLFRVLADQLGLPDGFLDDPVPVFAGDSGGGRPPVHQQARNTAMRLDREHFHAEGSMMATNALSKRLQAELNLNRPYSRASLDRWRLEADYREWVAFPITPLPKSD
jgi:hypothetical protein